jgi:predicted DNA-binding transcriptional regulator AlpA
MADVMPTPGADLMTVDEVAALCRTTRKTVLNRRSRGLAPKGFRVGGVVLFHRNDVMRWLDEQRAADRVGSRTA